MISDASFNPNPVYALGSSPGETERLQRKADELVAAYCVLLYRAPLGPGDAAIDLGYRPCVG